MRILKKGDHLFIATNKLLLSEMLLANHTLSFGAVFFGRTT
jgi:hypothetical protein